MLMLLRDRQSALAVAILFLVASTHAALAHRLSAPGLDAWSAVATDGPSLCSTGERDRSALSPRCDACRLIDAPGLIGRAHAPCASPAMADNVAAAAHDPLRRDARRPGAVKARAPPRA